ncbi:hypothetical protein ASG43_21475 [Aureimonas sp. Leaf454]|uniref:hypothetical protein n=1 Tax=Aureimonas sp. Leaf454 TaxID=1736381 RepID=UPI0006F62A29|nr:hypothetical protein [Aureimonas sp. Leaf454]KQT51178.1 hypothetical protein ASG43_21475 [Aureimonas sp. Leaf454]
MTVASRITQHDNGFSTRRDWNYTVVINAHGVEVAGTYRDGRTWRIHDFFVDPVTGSRHLTTSANPFKFTCLADLVHCLAMTATVRTARPETASASVVPPSPYPVRDIVEACEAQGFVVDEVSQRDDGESVLVRSSKGTFICLNREGTRWSACAPDLNKLLMGFTEPLAAIRAAVGFDLPDDPAVLAPAPTLQ